VVINLVDIKTIGIVGAGQIGRGISQDYSTAGYQVLLVDVAEPPLTEALTKIRLGLERGPRNGETLPTIKPGRS
jgi:3-hydroxybutyryl-CoA dehydrogenase